MNEQQTLHQPKPIVVYEIDLIALAKRTWNGRRTILVLSLVGAILGSVIALTTPNEFTATSIMVPQFAGGGETKLGGLGGLAALAGISLNMNQSTELSPIVYPQIVSSVPFQLELMNARLNFQGYKEPISLFDYFTTNSTFSVLGMVKKFTVGLPRLLIGAIKGPPKKISLPGDSINFPIRLTDSQVLISNALEALVVLDVNSKDGYLTLTVRMPEPLAAAQLAQKAQKLLQGYITEFKIEKAKNNLDFIQGRYNETKAEFEKAQVSLALVNDRNKNFTSGLSQIEADRIQTRYTIAFNVFQELAKQLEQAKIQVKQDTPVFTIIEPVSVPTIKSKPSRLVILTIGLILGGMIGICIVFGRQYITTIKNQWNEA